MMSRQASLYIGADSFLLISFALYPMIIWSTMSGNGDVTSLLFYGLIICVALLFVFTFTKIDSRMLGLFLLISIISLYSVIVSDLKNNIGISFKGLVNYISFVLCMAYILFVSYYNDISQQTVRRINSIGLLAAALYPIGYVVFDFNTNVNLFTMNFSNPNLTGMFLVQAIFYAVMNLFIPSKIWRKVLCVLIASIDTWLLLATQARNCILTLALVFALVVWGSKKKNSFSSLFVFLITIFPLIFLAVYMIFSRQIVYSGYFDIFVSEGKSLTSRIGLWNAIFRELNGNLIFGNYFVIGGNAHNSLLSIWAGFGSVVLLLSIRFLYQAMNHCMKTVNSQPQLICFAMFCGTMFMGMAEGSLFCGSVGLFLPACTFLLFSRTEW